MSSLMPVYMSDSSILIHEGNRTGLSPVKCSMYLASYRLFAATRLPGSLAICKRFWFHCFQSDADSRPSSYRVEAITKRRFFKGINSSHIAEGWKHITILTLAICWSSLYASTKRSRVEESGVIPFSGVNTFRS